MKEKITKEMWMEIYIMMCEPKFAKALSDIKKKYEK